MAEQNVDNIQVGKGKERALTSASLSAKWAPHNSFFSSLFSKFCIVTYVWIDGDGGMRSKNRTFFDREFATVHDIDKWTFDGSSTKQTSVNKSDLVLKPVFAVQSPIYSETQLPAARIIALCEVLCDDGVTPHPTNHRAKLRALLEKSATVVKEMEPWFGMEQEYYLLEPDDDSPSNLHKAYPCGYGYEQEPQGKYYCSVGADRAFGREVVNRHYVAALWAGLRVHGTNAEVGIGQWEFQVGICKDPLEMGDHLWLARYLLLECAEHFGYCISFHPKEMRCKEWNGSGCHTNFSTAQSRGCADNAVLNSLIDKLEATHTETMQVYGKDNELRSTGENETSEYNTFSRGATDRNKSVRIPILSSLENKGYLEDRRPAANCDPYQVVHAILQSVI